MHVYIVRIRKFELQQAQGIVRARRLPDTQLSRPEEPLHFICYRAFADHVSASIDNFVGVFYKVGGILLNMGQDLCPLNRERYVPIRPEYHGLDLIGEHPSLVPISL